MEDVGMAPSGSEPSPADNGEGCELLHTDTDSLLLEIHTEDIYKGMVKEACRLFYDTFDSPQRPPTTQHCK